MAFVSREFAAPPAAVFAVLADPTSYPQWLIGAEAVEHVDAAWPAPGSTFDHRVGVGRLALPDTTTLLSVETDRVLQLRVRARPLIAAVVTFHVIGDDHRCVVTMEEEPARRIIGNLVRPMMDPIIHVRNHRSLGRLATVVEQRTR